MHYAKLCRDAGILTSLDGGAVRINTMELLRLIDITIVSERIGEQLNLTEAAALDLLKEEGCKIDGVTLGERGLIWYDEMARVAVTPVLAVPAAKIVDTNGAGDMFHGAYIYSYLAHPDASWRAHLESARGALAHAIRSLGNEAHLPTGADIEAAIAHYQPSQSVPA